MSYNSLLKLIIKGHTKSKTERKPMMKHVLLILKGMGMKFQELKDLSFDRIQKNAVN